MTAFLVFQAAVGVLQKFQLKKGETLFTVGRTCWNLCSRSGKDAPRFFVVGVCRVSMPDLLGFRLRWWGVGCAPQVRMRFRVGNGVEGKAMRPALYDAGWGRLGVWQMV